MSPVFARSPRHPEGLRDGVLKRGGAEAFAFIKSWRFGVLTPVVAIVVYFVTPEPLLGLLAPFLVAGLAWLSYVFIAPYWQRNEAREALADYHREEQENAAKSAAEYRVRMGLDQDL